MATSPPEGEFNFTLSWGVMEWIMSGIAGAVVSFGLWVVSLGRKVDQLSEKVQTLEETVKTLEVTMDARLRDIEEERLKLKAEILTRISNLPNHNFIESQLHTMTLRIDRLLETKLLSRKD